MEQALTWDRGEALLREGVGPPPSRTRQIREIFLLVSLLADWIQWRLRAS
jgi:hypothetical protein